MFSETTPSEIILWGLHPKEKRRAQEIEKNKNKVFCTNPVFLSFDFLKVDILKFDILKYNSL
jgi:hypothetical protein